MNWGKVIRTDGIILPHGEVEAGFTYLGILEKIKEKWQDKIEAWKEMSFFSQKNTHVTW